MSGTRKKFNIHSRGTQDRLFCFILLLPAIILCITFIIIPIIDSVWMSFTDYKIANLTWCTSAGSYDSFDLLDYPSEKPIETVLAADC